MKYLAQVGKRNRNLPPTIHKPLTLLTKRKKANHASKLKCKYTSKEL